MLHHLRTLLLPILMPVLLLATPAFSTDTPAGNAPEASGRLSGQFTLTSGAPMAGGRLFVYGKRFGPPSSDHYVRVPDLIETLDAQGKFSLELPADSYYLSAITMPENGAMGPPPAGEPIYYQMNAKGEIQPFTVVAGKETTAGVISTMTPYRRDLSSYEKGATVIEGTVTDADGAPVAGAIILVHLTAGTQDKAVYVSERTAGDGNFRLRLVNGGTYYLRVRGEYHGGAPNEGDIVNLNDPKEQIAVAIKRGERLTGVKILVKRQPPKGPLNKR